MGIFLAQTFGEMWLEEGDLSQEQVLVFSEPPPLGRRAMGCRGLWGFAAQPVTSQHP